MLTSRTLLDDEGVTLADVACRHQPGRGNAIELRTTHALVFVRRGCFVRASDGHERLLDPTVAYATTPGQEERIDHPLQGGDDCMYLALAPELAAALWGGDPALPTRPLPTSPAVDLEHRLLLAAARRGDDRHEVTERALALATAVLERHDADRVASLRPATARTRRAPVDEGAASARRRRAPRRNAIGVVALERRCRQRKRAFGHLVAVVAAARRREEQPVLEVDRRRGGERAGRKRRVAAPECRGELRRQGEVRAIVAALERMVDPLLLAGGGGVGDGRIEQPLVAVGGTDEAPAAHEDERVGGAELDRVPAPRLMAARHIGEGDAFVVEEGAGGEHERSRLRRPPEARWCPCACSSSCSSARRWPRWTSRSWPSPRPACAWTCTRATRSCSSSSPCTPWPSRRSWSSAPGSATWSGGGGRS